MKSEQGTVLAFVMGFCGCLMLVILVAIMLAMAVR